MSRKAKEEIEKLCQKPKVFMLVVKLKEKEGRDVESGRFVRGNDERLGVHENDENEKNMEGSQ